MIRRNPEPVGLCILMVLALCCVTRSSAQSKPFRPPAVPLAACDPYFSIWSFSDQPADDWPRHWTGAVQALSSIVRIDGVPYRLIGKAPQKAAAMKMEDLKITPTRTIYRFGQNGIKLTLTFLTPMLPGNIDLLSRPVTYVSWKVESTDGKDHSVSVYFDNSAELVVNTPDQEVEWARYELKDLDVLRMGALKQDVLGKSGDDLRIDWGHFYLVSPKNQEAKSVMASYKTRDSFAINGSLPVSDDIRMPRQAQDDWPVLAYAFDLGKVGPRKVERYLVMAYDDLFSVEYFFRRLQPYWRSTGFGAGDLLEKSAEEFQKIKSECEQFDDEVTADFQRAGGEKYEKLASLSYRQAFAAHKLAADIDGTPLLFPKENFSNGCISTVDVIYPSAPIFLLFNVDLLKAAVTPVFQYSAMKRWRFPFAPHDLGTYPLADGQVYGGGEEGLENQMPVEECGNLLILTYAIACAEGSADFASKYWPSLEKWAHYLKEKGLDPENQLCTDDFAGHLAHNVNLSLKAILALGSYSKLCEMGGRTKEAGLYRQTAESFARKWEQMADDGDHYRLAFDMPGTWSQKYNLVWDRLLGLNLFSEEIARKETRYYMSKQNSYGLPLDCRKDYTKLDWTVWTATLAQSKEDFEEMISRVYDFADKTPDRVPLSDWYDTKTARQVGFQARSVVGGVFIKMLSDPQVWNKWLHRQAH